MVNSTLSDAITRIRNGYAAGLPEIKLPQSKLVLAVAEVLAKHGYLEKVVKEKDGCTATLKYEGKDPIIVGIKGVSKPGQRVYTQYKAIPKVWGGLGINILSTSKGIMTEKEARKNKLGGELLVQVW